MQKLQFAKRDNASSHTHHWSGTAGINGEFETGGKRSLIAQLVDSVAAEA